MNYKVRVEMIEVDDDGLPTGNEYNLHLKSGQELVYYITECNQHIVKVHELWKGGAE